MWVEQTPDGLWSIVRGDGASIAGYASEYAAKEAMFWLSEDDLTNYLPVSELIDYGIYS